MQLSDDDRITYQPYKRSPATLVLASLVALAAAGGSIYYYLNYAGNSRPTAAPTQAMHDTSQPSAVMQTSPTVEPPPVAQDAVAASEPPLEPAPDAAPLPPLDASDAGIRQELSGLAGWQSQAMDLLVSDQLLRRFVILVSNTAAGKLDHKSGPLRPIKGRFTVATNTPLTMTQGSQARYNIYISALTSLDPQQCANLYRRYYPLLNNAYQELGEKNNFHALVLKAIQQLENTPDLSQTPVLVPGDKGLYHYAQPQLEALPAVQKQMLRSGWENVSKTKVWLRQFKSALLTPPA